MKGKEMFQDTYVYTHSGLKNGFLLIGKILVYTLLTILTLGNYSLFAITGIFAWILKGIEINCEAIKVSKISKKNIFLNIIFYQLVIALWSLSFYYMFYAIGSNDSFHIFIATVSVILVSLFSFNWLAGYLFHQTISRCSLGTKQIMVEGTSISFANRVLKQFIFSLPLIIVTGGIYMFWFSVKQLGLMINSCYVENKTFKLKNDFSAGVVLVYSLFASFLSMISFGIGTPWIFLSIIKRFIEQYISFEDTDDITIAKREVINMKKDKPKKIKQKDDDLLDDLNINDIHSSKKIKMLPFVIIFLLILVLVVSYFGYKFLLIQKKKYDDTVIQEHYDDRIDEEKNAKFNKFTSLCKGEYLECLDSSSMMLIKGSKDEPFGILKITKETFKYYSEIDSLNYNISDLTFKTDSAVSLNLEASNGSFTTLTIYVNDSGRVVLQHLPNSTDGKIFVSTKDTSKYLDELNFMSDLWDSTFKNAMPISKKTSYSQTWQKERFLTLDSTYKNVQINDIYFRDVDGYQIILFHARYKRKVDEFSELESNSGFFQSVNGTVEKINVPESNYYISSIKQFLSFKDERGEIHRYKIPQSKEDSLNHNSFTRIRRYTAPNKHYAVCVVDAKMWLEYKKGNTTDTIIKQEYDGEWSFGEVAWNENSSEFYVDNSGPTACIWKYSLVDKNFIKIIPEHDAVLPFWYEENGNGALYYVEGRYIKKAVPENSEILMSFIKDICLGWSNSKSTTEGHDYFPKGGLRTKISHLLSFGSIGKWEKIANMPVFLKGPHTSTSVNLNDSLSFGHYNPKFVEWVLENLLIVENNERLKKLLEPIYDKYLRDFINNMYTTVKRLESVDDCFKKDVARYSEAYETGDAKKMRFFRSYNFVKDSCGLKGYEAEWNAIDGNQIDSSIAFWVRRSVDGTYPLFKELVFRIYNAFPTLEEEYY